MSYETKFQQKGERGPAERASFQREKYEATLWLILKNSNSNKIKSQPLPPVFPLGNIGGVPIGRGG